MATKENKARYKKTKLGLIPEDWDLEKLLDLGKFSKGKGISKSELVEEGIPCVRYGEIYTHHDYVIKKYYSFIDNKTAETSQKIKKNDILFAGSGETLEDIGKCVAYIGEEDAYASGDVIILSPKNVDSIFFSYSLNSNLSIKQKYELGQGYSIVHLYSRDLGKLCIPLPPLPEQKKIAKILSTWDDAIATTEKLIAAKEKLKKGLMQQLLTGKKRFKEFEGNGKYKKTIFGLIPEDWQLKEIGNSIDLLTGFPFKSEQYTDKIEHIKLVRGINITQGRLRWGEHTKCWKNITKDLNKYFLKSGDLLIGMDGSLVGKNYAMVKEEDLPLLLVQRVARIRCNNKLNIDYLFQFIGNNYFVRYVDSVSTSSGIPHISADQINKFKIPTPSLAEQQKIASVLSTFNREIQTLKDKLNALQSQKKGLMQQLLTGKVRVKIDS